MRTSDNHEDQGYNSEDEVTSQAPRVPATREQYLLEIQFEQAMHKAHNFKIRKMKPDGACLFRAIADQLYGDQEMHRLIRSDCVEYMRQERARFSPFVTEEFDRYLKRKSRSTCFGNHLEIQAICELYNRRVEVYSYSTVPINTFTSRLPFNRAHLDLSSPPFRLSYHANSHYNSVMDPTAELPKLPDTEMLRMGERESDRLFIEESVFGESRYLADLEETQRELEQAVLEASLYEMYPSHASATLSTGNSNNNSTLASSSNNSNAGASSSSSSFSSSASSSSLSSLAASSSASASSSSSSSSSQASASGSSSSSSFSSSSASMYNNNH